MIYSIVKSMVNKVMQQKESESDFLLFMGCRTVKVNMLQEMGMGEVPNGNLDTTTALIYDSVTAFAIALNKLDTVQQVNGDDDD